MEDGSISAGLDEILGEVEQLNPAGVLRVSDSIVSTIYTKAEKIAQKVVFYEEKDNVDWDEKLDNIFTSKIFGFPAMIFLLAIVFWITLVGANYPSQVLGTVLFWVQDCLVDPFSRLNTPAWTTGLLVNGIYCCLAWVISVMLPPMAIFFPCFALLEDMGYLARVAFNLDNLFKKVGAHGKQALTMCMGFGCNAAGIISCRIIESPRDRLMAMLTNNFVPCNGRFPTLITLACLMVVGEKVFLGATPIVIGIVFLGIIMTFAVSFALSKTFLKGIPLPFALELPPYRKPQLGRIIVRSIFDRTLFVLRRAVFVTVPAGAFIWLLSNTYIGQISLLEHGANFLNPFGRLLGMDGYILMAFFLGFPANEIVLPILIMSYTATGSITGLDGLNALRHLFIVEHGWTWLTAFCMMLFSLLHYPCGTTLFTILRESGSFKWTVLSAFIPFCVACTMCLAVAWLARFWGWA